MCSHMGLFTHFILEGFSCLHRLLKLTTLRHSWTSGTISIIFPTFLSQATYSTSLQWREKGVQRLAISPGHTELLPELERSHSTLFREEPRSVAKRGSIPLLHQLPLSPTHFTFRKQLCNNPGTFSFLIKGIHSLRYWFRIFSPSLLHRASLVSTRRD